MVESRRGYAPEQFLLGVSEIKAGGCLTVLNDTFPLSSPSVTLTVGMLQWNRERRGIRREGEERRRYEETMRSQTRCEWMNGGGGKWLKKEWIKSEKKESKARGRSVIKTQGEEDEERTGERREGTVIDCLVSPHAPVTELIGVAKTKRREVSVTSEPFSRRAVHVKLRWDEPPPAFSPPSSLSATQRRCCESARKVKLHSFFAGIKKKI